MSCSVLWYPALSCCAFCVWCCPVVSSGPRVTHWCVCRRRAGAGAGTGAGRGSSPVLGERWMLRRNWRRSGPRLSAAATPPAEHRPRKHHLSFTAPPPVINPGPRHHHHCHRSQNDSNWGYIRYYTTILLCYIHISFSFNGKTSQLFHKKTFQNDIRHGHYRKVFIRWRCTYVHTRFTDKNHSNSTKKIYLFCFEDNFRGECFYTYGVAWSTTTSKSATPMTLNPSIIPWK